jgi:hypothetical protein
MVMSLIGVIASISAVYSLWAYVGTVYMRRAHCGQKSPKALCRLLQSLRHLPDAQAKVTLPAARMQHPRTALTDPVYVL